jgi:putative nucleotidyltransferase with HDIG domain
LNLDPYLLIPVVEVVFMVGLIVVLLTRGQKHVARNPFFLFLLAMSLWGAFIFLMRDAASLPLALFWERFVLASILSSAIFFYWFTISLTGRRPRKIVFYTVHAFYLACLALIPTNFIVSDMQMMWYGKAPVVGPLFAPYVLTAYAPLVLGLVTLVKHGRRSGNADERIRTQYIIAGMTAMFICATTDYLPPLGISMYPLGIVGNILFAVMATVAMLRYDLLEMKVVLRKGLAYSLVGVVLIAIFGGQIMLLGNVFDTALSPISITIAIVSVLFAIIVITFFQPILPVFQRVVDRWFFRERYDHLQTLKRFTEETRDIIDLRRLASSLVTSIANGMQSKAVYLLLPSQKTGDFVEHSYYGKSHVKQLTFQASSLLTLTMKYEDGVIDVNDTDVSPTLSVLTADEKAVLTRDQIELLVPLGTKGQLIGMLLVGSKISSQAYSVEDRHLLQKIAREVTTGIDNALSFESIQQEHGELLEALDGIIHAMCLIVETRDPYTAGHQQRVADIACAIARTMGLSEWSIKGVRMAGLLHDIGKLSVPAEILTKPGKLNNSEFAIIRSHSKVSYDILEMIEFPWPVKQAILQHHERLDGSGYPDGIGGDEITLEARILGVADVVEAISSHRPYRPALGPEYALKEILDNKGVLYDPKVVDACIKLFQEKEDELEQLLLPAVVA